MQHLHRSYSEEFKAGLDGVKAILYAVNNPQCRIPVIHVAGTNGKGSTCAYLQHILTEAGYKTGVFTSPHLKQYNERIAIDNQSISDKNFAKQLNIIAEASKCLNLKPSFFELLTCMAYNYFAEESVDVAIIETGIGGRLDSTNVIDKPILSVITAPGLDHQELLGSTIDKISAEDAGIVKQMCPVAVYFTQNPLIFKKGHPLYHIGEDLEIYDVSYSLGGSKFSVRTPYFSYQSLNIQLLGEHQITNAIHVLLCVTALRENMQIPQNAVINGLAKCKWPGRFEIVSSKPHIVLDGAHNEDSAKVYKSALKRYFPQQKNVVVVGISINKDYKSTLPHILKCADVVICTRSHFKAMKPEALADSIKKQTNAPVFTECDCKEAVKMAVELAGENGVVTVTGSLYLVGNVRTSIYSTI